MELNSQAIFSNPTTGFLTATTFIYALGAGITAAAGTRLALQLILISVSGYSPLQSLTHVCASKLLFFVAASPGIGIGQFARLLLTVVMVAISQAPSPESNPNSPLPVNGKVVNYTTFNLIGGKFVQQRAHKALSRHSPASTVVAAEKRRWFLFRRTAPRTTVKQPGGHPTV